MFIRVHSWFPKRERLPLYLLDAIRAFGDSETLRAALGESFSDSYMKLKLQEWNDYCRHLTHWERQHTLDC